ncbi:unannotated protein [freshwater metagenome]|uniref:Unannotated protein n=1 Tax=freshwater metagenome TaxID=449393 RepID=A0A6J7HQP0_9ZZZZ
MPQVEAVGTLTEPAHGLSAEDLPEGRAGVTCSSNQQTHDKGNREEAALVEPMRGLWDADENPDNHGE